MEDMDTAGVAELMRGLGLGGIAEKVEAERLTSLMLLELIKRDGLATIGAEGVLTQSKIAGEVEQRQRRATMTRDASQAGMETAPAPKRVASGSRGAADSGEDSEEEQDSDAEVAPPQTTKPKPKKRRRRRTTGASTKKPKKANDIRRFFRGKGATAAAGKTPEALLNQRRAEMEKQDALNQEAEYEAKVEREKTLGPAAVPAAFKLDHKKLVAVSGSGRVRLRRPQAGREKIYYFFLLVNH
eukprot:COSAG04_NODE_4625_length_1985_cov_16.974549_1_plen_242_part_00